MYADKTYREKVRQELLKNAMDYIEQILEATPDETTAIRLLPSHLPNYPNKTNKTCGILLKKKKKDEFISDILLSSPTHEDLPGAMDDRDGWRASERESGKSVLAA